MGRHFSKLSPQNKQQVTKNFELAKIAFRNDESYPTYWVGVPTVGDIEEVDIVAGQFPISREEMKSLFDPIIDQIIELIKGQIILVSTGREVVNSILLVGGFGESEYLYQRVHEWALKYDIQVIQPRDASTAIVRGAVLKGLEPKTGPSKTEVSRRARRSYGVPTSKQFIPGVHSPEDLFVDPESGQQLARNQVSWFIRKVSKTLQHSIRRNLNISFRTTSSQTTKDSVSDTPTYHFPDVQIPNVEQSTAHTFSRNFKHLTPWIDSLVSSTEEVPPQRVHDPSVHRHCTITSDLSHLKKKKFKRKWRKLSSYYVADYDLLLQLKGNHLALALEYMGQQYGVANVDFERE